MADRSIETKRNHFTNHLRLIMAKKKDKEAKLPFMDILAIKLNVAKVGEIRAERESDNKWIVVYKDGITISFVFDGSGNNIESLSVHKDIMEVVDQEKIF